MRREEREPRDREIPRPRNPGRRGGEIPEDQGALAGWEGEGGAVPSEPTSTPVVGSVVTEEVDYKDRWLRAEAELQNYRRRARREAEEGKRAAEEGVLLDLVTLLDDLERALESAGESGAPRAWVDGVALVLRKGRDYLERQDLVMVDPLGMPFDPNLHEAILEVEAGEGVAAGTVVQVAHKGCRRGNRALRAARVVVARERVRGSD